MITLLLSSSYGKNRRFLAICINPCKTKTYIKNKGVRACFAINICKIKTYVKTRGVKVSFLISAYKIKTYAENVILSNLLGLFFEKVAAKWFFAFFSCPDALQMEKTYRLSSVMDNR